MRVFRKIYQELLLIRKELQTVRSSMEFDRFIPEDSCGKHYPRQDSCGCKNN